MALLIRNLLDKITVFVLLCLTLFGLLYIFRGPHQLQNTARQSYRTLRPKDLRRANEEHVGSESPSSSVSLADAAKNWSAIQLDRKTTLNKICLKYNLTRSTKDFTNVAKQLYVEHSHKIIYCEVPKAGCSNWKRILILLHMNLSREPEEIDHEAVHYRSPVRTLTSYPQDQWMKYLNSYTKVIFTRDPLERLVSAYRDKVLHSHLNPYYSGYVADIIRKYLRISRTPTANITFIEFVRYLLQEDPEEADSHWRQMNKLCDPCNIQYDVIGKLSTLHEDVSNVLKIIRAPKHIYYSSTQQYPGEALTNEKMTKDYLKKLSNEYLQELIKQYQLDFYLFNYSINITSSF